MMTTGAEIIGKLHLMQAAIETMTGQVESITEDKLRTDRAIAIYKANEEHHEHMMACRDVSIEALKKAIYTKSSHHAKLAALVKANLTEEQVQSYKAKSHKEALRLHQATTEKNDELYAKEEKAERATIDLHKKKILSIKEKFKTAGNGAATKDVRAPTQGPKGSIAKKTKDGKPKAAKKPSPTTPRCRFISAMTSTWSDERDAAQLTKSDEPFPALFAWINPRWTALSAADRQPYLDAFAADLEDKKAAEEKGEVWVNQKKQKTENGTAAKGDKKGDKKDSKKDSKKGDKKDSKKITVADPDTEEEADTEAEAESGGEDEDEDMSDKNSHSDDDDGDDAASGDDKKTKSQKKKNESDDEDEEEEDDEEDEDAKASGSDSD